MGGLAHFLAPRLLLMPLASTLCICSILLSGAALADASASRVFKECNEGNLCARGRNGFQAANTNDGEPIWAQRGARRARRGKVAAPGTWPAADSAPASEVKFGRRSLQSGIDRCAQSEDQNSFSHRPFQVVEIFRPSLLQGSGLIGLSQKIIAAFVNSLSEMWSADREHMQLPADEFSLLEMWSADRDHTRLNAGGWNRERGLRPNIETQQELRLGRSSQVLGPIPIHQQSGSFEDSSQRRVLLADISPPGLWPDDDQDDQPKEFLEF